MYFEKNFLKESMFKMLLFCGVTAHCDLSAMEDCHKKSDLLSEKSLTCIRKIENLNVWRDQDTIEAHIKVLLEEGVDSNYKIQGDRLLHIAARIGSISAIDLLLEKGANVNKLNDEGENALRIALRFFPIVALKLLQFPAINLKKKCSNSPGTILPYAIQPGIFFRDRDQCKKIVLTFVAKGLDVNYPLATVHTEATYPPLICAVVLDDKELAKILLDKGANPDLECYDHNLQFITPRKFAEKNGKLDFFQ